MNFKRIIAVNSILVFIGVSILIYLQYQLRPEVLGGFKAGTEEYFGYRYARDNELKSADQCDDEKNDPQMKIKTAFVKGCEAFFKKEIVRE